MPSTPKPGKAIKPRKGMPSLQLAEAEFKQRYNDQFFDPAIRGVQAELDKVIDIAWDAYDKSREIPVTQKGGPSFSNAKYDLSINWIAAHEAVKAAQLRHGEKKVDPPHSADQWIVPV